MYYRAANKVSRKEITGISPEENIYEEKKNKKKVQVFGNEASLRRFHKRDFYSFHLHMEYSQRCFNIRPVFSTLVKHPLFPCIVHYEKVLYKMYTGNRKKDVNFQFLFTETFYFKIFFS